jgi:hypothetical protein
MVKRLLLLLALLMPSLASAQTVVDGFVVPPDVTWNGYVTPTWEAGQTAQNEPIDASVTTAPALTAQLADIPSTVTNQLETGTYNDASGFCTTVATGGSCTQAKVRFHAEDTTMKPDDPIRNFGQPGGSHCHQFFGNYHVNAYSTYASLRGGNNIKGRRAFFPGTDLNATAYWRPCMLLDDPFGNGKNYAVRSNMQIIYYESDPSLSPKFSDIPRGLRYVFGFNMDDPSWSFLQAYIDAANAQTNTAGRYRLTNPNNDRMHTDAKYSCFATGLGATGTRVDKYWLKNADDSDPWAGQCVTGDTFYIAITGPSCWDAENLWSPGGYRHVLPKIWDTKKTGSGDKWVCPNNYHEIPELVINIYLTHQGFADYGRWYLASDAMGSVAAGRTLLPGESFHTDWFGAWDGATMTAWLHNCLGTMGNTPHECNQGIISSTQSLRYGGANQPGGGTFTMTTTNPDPAYTTDSAANMLEVPASWGGPATVGIHH